MANRYWVGGSGLWNTSNTSNWSETSGGSSGASAPIYIDDVFFDANSGSNVFTVSVGNNSVCQNLTISGLANTMTLSLGGSNTFYCYGDLFFPSTNLVSSMSGTTAFYSNSAITRTITTNGNGIANPFFNGVGGSWQLGSALSASGLTLRSGTLNTASFGVSLNNFTIDGSNTKSLFLGSSTVSLGPGGGVAWNNASTPGSLTLDAGTSLITHSLYGVTFIGGGLSYYDIDSTQGSYGGDLLIADANNSFNNVSIYPFSFHASYKTGLSLAFGGGESSNTIIRGTLKANSAAGAFTPVNPASIPWGYAYIYSNDGEGIPTTLTVNKVELQDAVFRDINLKGNAAAQNPLVSTGRVGDLGNNTGINFDRRTVYWVRDTGTNFLSNAFSLSSGGSITASAFPFPGVDTVIIDNNSKTSNIANPITINSSYLLTPLAINTQPRTTETVIEFNTTYPIYGNLYFGNSTTIKTNTSYGFNFTGLNKQDVVISDNIAFPSITVNKTRTRVNVTDSIYNSVNVSMITGNTINCMGTLTLSSGVLNISDPQITTINVGAFSSSGTTYREIDFLDKTFNITGNNATVWTNSTPTNLIYSRQPNGITVNVNRPSWLNPPTANIRTITVGTPVFLSNTVNFNISAGSDAITITGVPRDLNLTGFSGTLTNSARTLYGNLTLGSATTTNVGSAVTTFGGVPGDVATKTITGNTFDLAMTFNGVGNTWLMYTNGSPTINLNQAVILTTGKINVVDPNITTVNALSFSSSGSTVREIDFFGKTFNVTGNNTTIWNTSTFTNLTFSRWPNNIPTFNVTNNATGGTRTLTTGAPSFLSNSISFNVTTGSDSITFSNFRDSNFTGFTGFIPNAARNVYGNLNIGTTATINVGSAVTTFLGVSGDVTKNITGNTFNMGLTFNGVGNTWLMYTNGSPTINLNQAVTLTAGKINLADPQIATVNMLSFSSSGSTAREIDVFGKTFNITGNGGTVWQTSTDTNLIYSRGIPTVNLSNNAITGTRTVDPSGSTTLANLVNFNISSGSDTFNIVGGRAMIRDLNFTGFSGTYTNQPTRLMYGNLILSSTMTLSSGVSTKILSGVFGDNPIKIIDGKNILMDFPLQINGANTWQLLSTANVGSGRATSITNNATVDLSYNGGQRFRSGSYSFTSGSINFNGGTLEVLGTSFTGAAAVGLLNRESGNIVMSSTSAKTFAGGGLLYPALDVAGNGTLTITGANRFQDITNSEKNTIILLPASTTTTVNNFSYSGNATVRSNVTSSTGGTRATLSGAGSQFSYGTSYLSIKDVSATNGTWITTYSLNVSNNLGWVFGVFGARLANTGILYATTFDETFPAGLKLWGNNNYGQLGLGDTDNRSSPVQVGWGNSAWQEISCGLEHTAIIQTNNSLQTWGKNDFGQLGLNDTVDRSSPTQVGSLTDWKQVSTAFNGSACVKTDGTLWMWGRNTGGQLGLNDILSRSSPTQVGSLTDWQQVSCGSISTACVKTDGTLWMWGTNNLGQLGLSDTIDRSSPVQVGSLTDWQQVSCGSNHTACVKNDGTLWIWGLGSAGRLGLGDTINRSSPVQVGTLTNWKQVSCGANHTACVKTDGTLWTWGNNDSGMLGLGNTLLRSSPVQVGSLTNWQQVSCGQSVTGCVKTDNTLWIWGRNDYGQAGLGDTINRSSPVQVGSLTNWKQVSCSGFHTGCTPTSSNGISFSSTSLLAQGFDETSTPNVAMRQFSNNNIQVSGSFDETTTL